MKIAYLGPDGTFSQQAAARLCPQGDLTPFNALADVFDAVRHRLCEAAVVPFENSTEGTVNETLDHLLFGETPLYIESLLPLPIRQCLLLNARAETEAVVKIVSHPQSLAQCRRYLRTHFEGVETAAVISNSEAARLVSVTDAPWAAIGPSHAAARYGLRVRETGIQDQAHNITAFLRVSPQGQARPRRGCRTSLAFATHHEPGELYRMLGIFDVYRLNMTKILSRPRAGKPGEYMFYIDIEDYVPRDAARALTLLKERTSCYRFLGSYPVVPYASSEPV